MAGRSNSVRADDTKRADVNRVKTLAAVRQLHRLMALAVAPGFHGTVGVEVSAKDGVLGNPKLTLVEYDRSADESHNLT